MHLAASLYVTIEGTTVVLAPRSAEEARRALKELRHKRREFAWVKRSLLRQKKAAFSRAGRTMKRDRRRKTGIAWIWNLFARVSALPRLLTRARARMDLAEIERECQRIEEIQHNIDSAILQVEGKLLREV
jgi:hypothetical protein